ncbi:hypothetical protein NQ315_008929 [Exocentrus adspersus]|uniref:Possible tRNA binding domain-containing protein n=1 Tax=Exocentrus adspersus TaxID=1586481 RepID=A0AAV8V617_9CUCU|nr:hypothetical protein NQ315_008929 [Exocentrus adspersus]
MSVHLTRELLDIHLTKFDMRRLEMYSNNLVDYHLIMDLIPTLAELYFLYLKDAIRISALQVVSIIYKIINHLKNHRWCIPKQVFPVKSYSTTKEVILLGIGLQHKTIDNLKMELSLPSSQLLGLFNRLIRCYIHYLNRIVEDNFEKKLKSKKVNMVAVSEDIEHDLKTTARKIKKKSG